MIQNREDLKEYILRALGEPLIQVDVTNEQMDDRIDDARSFFDEYYWDGVIRTYIKYQITQQDIDEESIQIPDNVWAITNVFMVPQYSDMSQPIMWSQAFERMHTFTDFSPGYHEQVMEHLALLDELLTNQRRYQFNRLEGKLRIDVNWAKTFVKDQYIVIEAHQVLDPDVSIKMWNERLFKKYCVTAVKKQWGYNLKKFQGISLPGGVQVDGNQLYSEASQELQEQEEWIIRNTNPMGFSMA